MLLSACDTLSSLNTGISMKSFIIHAISAVIVFYYLDLFSDSIFLSIILPLVFLYFVFRLIAKVMVYFLGGPMYTKSTQAERKVIHETFIRKNRVKDK